MQSFQYVILGVVTATLLPVGAASAQNTDPVRLTTYRAYIESDYSVEITLSTGNKAQYYSFGYDENNKKQGYRAPGTWEQVGDKVTLKFRSKKGNTEMVYRVKTNNNDPSFKCKGPYGLAPISSTGANDLEGDHYLWPKSLLKADGPCL